MSNSKRTTKASDNVTANQLFSERLYVPWWGWPLPLLGAVLLAAEIHLGYSGIRSWLPYVLLVPLALALLMWLGRVKVEVKNGELWAGQAHLPIEFIGRVTPLTVDEKRIALGRDFDPAAFVVHRGWIGPAVIVEVTDATDPTPYWIVSTRHAARLATMLNHVDSHKADRESASSAECPGSSGHSAL